MKAKMTTSLVGEDWTLQPGDLIEGKRAAELCAAGYATPIREEIAVEKATAEKRETATRRK